MTSKKVTDINRLTITNPDLISQWHPTKNADLNPNDFSKGSSKKVWWLCSKNSNHIWEAVISDRVQGKNCPICAGQKVDITNCLATIYPEIAKQWHPTKNKNVTPFNVTSKSGKKFWWKCENGDDHEWITSVSKRADGYNCPVCSGQKVVKSNCLATISPDIASEWHPTKNGTLTPFDVSNVSGKIVWWKCSKDNEHEWKTTVAHRVNGRKCPICGNKKVVLSNSLKTTHPQLALEWNYELNNITPESVTAGSDKSVWWKCSKGDDHNWKAKIGERASGNSCPVCAGRKVVLSNCLATINPKLASEWHPTKNNGITPLNVTLHTRKKVWWKCPKGEDHEWQTTIDNRSKAGGRGCPICSNKIVVASNSLQNRFPKIAAEWDYNKNLNQRPDNIVWGSNKKVFWVCSNNEQHKWNTTVVARTSANSGCPFCTVFPQSKDELIILFELKFFFKNIDVKGQRIKVGKKVLAVDIYIQKLNLVVEFDGAFWHKDKILKDTEKNDLLRKANIQTIRIRQKPLTSIGENDIIVDKKVDYRKVVEKLLATILKYHKNNLTKPQTDKINSYLATDELLNISKAQRHIEDLLRHRGLKK